MAKPCSQGLNECVGHKQQPIIAPMTVSQAVPRDTVHWRSSHRQEPRGLDRDRYFVL